LRPIGRMTLGRETARDKKSAESKGAEKNDG
jgi:hypothetical protein